MNKIEREKAYKALPPLQTVLNARRMLAECDIFLFERYYVFPVPGVSCCRVWLGDEDIEPLNIGVNGKGMNARYAQASAYGEMMERLQNGALFPMRQRRYALEKGELLYHYAPDERYLSAREAAAECSDVVEAMFHLPQGAAQAFLERTAETDRVPCVPFYSVMEGRTRLLPAELIWRAAGTNGMCAGNTPEEAMLQGLMEVFERYAVKKLYQYGLTPPEIPADEFAGTQVLKCLAESGLRYSIRDLSLGKGYPVLALALWQPGGERAFHPGAAASREIALERCLTELCQGNARAVSRRFHRPGEGDETAAAWAYMTMVTDGSGAFSALDGPPSYPPHEAGEQFASDAQALSAYAGLVGERGSAVYVRDHSRLGFPVYRVYVPGASEAFLHYPLSRAEFAAWVRLRRASKIVYNLPGASGKSLKALADAMAGLKQARLPVERAPLERLADRSTPGAGAHEGAFEALLLGSVGRYGQAAQAMDAFLATDTANQTPRRLYRAYRDFWRALEAGEDEASALASCEKVYGATLAERCRTAHLAPNGLFDPRIWLQCPNCHTCALASRCLRDAMVQTWDSLCKRT